MRDDASIARLIAWACAQLADKSESPRLDAELLLARAIDVSRSYLYAHPEDVPGAGARERFRASLEKRTRGEPMAYVTGVREFWSMEFAVSPATLIPRPETELLVELALRELPRDATSRILDLGTGSGAIALALARERPACRITATDISADALELARLNARELGIGNIEFLRGDWVSPLRSRQFDLVISNPPYVREDDDALATLAYEPRGALVAGTDGLAAIRTLSRDCRRVVVPGGTLLLEHGAEQQALATAILTADGWRDIQCFDDHAGLPRVARATAAMDEV